MKKKFNNEILKLFIQINEAKGKKVSIDMPSGISTDSGQIDKVAVKADITLTFHRYKPGQWLLPAKEYCGKIKLLDIGLANLDNESRIKLNYPLKPPQPSIQEHKFTRGVCFIIAGKNLIGASKLAFLSASQSALRAGAGLCKLIVEESEIDSFKPHILEEMLITYKNTDNLQSIILNQKTDAIIYGCGIENNESNHNILNFLIQQPINLVLDATVFTMIQEKRDDYISKLKLRNGITIMTPHRGEFKRVFLVTENKITDTVNAARESNSIVIYKGNDTVIGSPKGEALINSNSSAFLATAGSGDVLAGLIGGFLSQGIDALNSAKLGCYIHSQCGINIGIGLTAADIIKEIPKVIKSIN